MSFSELSSTARSGDTQFVFKLRSYSPGDCVKYIFLMMVFLGVIV